MDKRRIWSYLTLALLLIVGFFLGRRALDAILERPVVSIAKLASNNPSGRLRMRRERADGGRLLITVEEASTIYAFDPEQDTMTEASPDVWTDASGLVGGKCQTSATRRDGRLIVGDKSIRTAGNVVMSYAFSPSGQYLAVLSANDYFRFRPPFPFLGGGGKPYDGQHYHQLFDSDLRLMRRTPVGIRAIHRLQTCWSPDEQFVIYSTISQNRACIVRVGDDR